MPIPGPMPYTDEWFAYRKYDPSREDHPLVFGASEASALLGLSPYTTPLDLYLNKLQGRTTEDNLAMKRGRQFESLILDIYSEEHGVELSRGLPMYFSDDCELLAATPDAMFLNGTKVVDAKKTSSRRYRVEGADDTQFGEDGTDQMPTEYLIQAQQLMAVMGVQEAVFPVLFDGYELRTYYVEFNDAIIDSLAKAAESMRKRIVEGNPPEPTYGAESTRQAIWDLYGRSDMEVVTLDYEIEALCDRRAELSETVKELEAELDEIRDRCAAAMQGAAIGVLPCGSRQLKRIDVKGCSYTVDRKPYSYIREVKVK